MTAHHLYPIASEARLVPCKCGMARWIAPQLYPTRKTWTCPCGRQHSAAFALPQEVRYQPTVAPKVTLLAVAMATLSILAIWLLLR